MRKKLKITCIDCGQVTATIIEINGWYDLENGLNINGIIHDDIIRIEIVLEADESNIIDKTK